MRDDLPEAAQVMIRAVHEQNAGVLDSLVDASVEALLREGEKRVRERVEVFAAALWEEGERATRRRAYSVGVANRYAASRLRAALTDEAQP